MSQPDPDFLKDLKKEQLHFVTDEQKGFSRKKQGKGFIYLDDNGKRIADPKINERINALAIPPAWKDVWISPIKNGYLQVTGYDEKGRKQYIYHEDWKKISQENKFKKMIFFGQVLPEIRRKIAKDMGDKDLSKEKILATVVWLLEHTFIRVGNDEYMRENNSFGLTTMRNRHVKIKGPEVTFDFKGKSGVDHTIRFESPKVAGIIKECEELPGYEIFQFVDPDGERHGIDSGDVNEYLRAVTGEDVSAKDFRTWGGTSLSAQTLHTLGFFETEEAAKKNINEAVKTVSTHLGNTPSVCRSYYIHPTVIDTYQERILIPHFDKTLSDSVKKDPQLSKKEYALLTLLQKYA